MLNTSRYIPPIIGNIYIYIPICLSAYINFKQTKYNKMKISNSEFGGPKQPGNHSGDAEQLNETTSLFSLN